MGTMPPHHDDKSVHGRFDSAAARQALAHLNRCHQLENLRLACLAQAEVAPPITDPAISRAWIAGLDVQGVDIVAESSTGPLVLRLSFGWPALSLLAAGEELRRLYRAACQMTSGG